MFPIMRVNIWIGLLFLVSPCFPKEESHKLTSTSSARETGLIQSCQTICSTSQISSSTDKPTNVVCESCCEFVGPESDTQMLHVGDQTKINTALQPISGNCSRLLSRERIYVPFRGLSKDTSWCRNCLSPSMRSCDVRGDSRRKKNKNRYKTPRRDIFA